MPSLVLNAGGSEGEELKKEYNFVITAIINIFLHGWICPLSTGNMVRTALSILLTVDTEQSLSSTIKNSVWLRKKVVLMRI